MLMLYAPPFPLSVELAPSRRAITRNSKTLLYREVIMEINCEKMIFAVLSAEDASELVADLNSNGFYATF